jgi:alpha-tubulin suppressor-like RCC1 family protein
MKRISTIAACLLASLITPIALFVCILAGLFAPTTLFAATPKLDVEGQVMVALKEDGTVWHMGAVGGATRGVPTQVVGVGGTGFLTGIVDVAAGNGFGVALKSDGTVYAWGSNNRGQLGDRTQNSSNTPVQVRAPGGPLAGVLTGVKSIAAGVDFAVAVMQDGTVLAWGDNTFGTLGSNTTVAIETRPVQVVSPDGASFLTNVKSASVGEDYVIVQRSDNTLWAWGSAIDGQLGNGRLPVVGSERLPVAVANIGATGIFAASPNVTTFATNASGQAFSWGSNAGDSLLGVGRNAIAAPTYEITPIAMHNEQNTPNLTGIKQFAAGISTAFALKNNGDVIGWGTDSSCQLAQLTPTASPYTFPIPIINETGNGALGSVSGVAAGSINGMAVKTNGDVLIWGESQSSLIPLSVTADICNPRAVRLSNNAVFNIGVIREETIYKNGFE